jgi:hypothetical protein
VLKTSTPKNAIEALNGCIWTKTIISNELSAYQSKHDVVSSHYTENNQLVIRVFSKSQPDATFETTTANLEDVYFVTLNHNV